MERTTEQPIIADTSGLVSLATDTDQNHEPAAKAAAQLRKASRPIILPVDVLVETVNVLGNNSLQESASAWLLCRLFFDTQRSAGLSKEMPSVSLS